jgi:hypothetical protein
MSHVLQLAEVLHEAVQLQPWLREVLCIPDNLRVWASLLHTHPVKHYWFMCSYGKILNTALTGATPFLG